MNAWFRTTLRIVYDVVVALVLGWAAAMLALVVVAASGYAANLENEAAGRAADFTWGTMIDRPFVDQMLILVWSSSALAAFLLLARGYVATRSHPAAGTQAERPTPSMPPRALAAAPSEAAPAPAAEPATPATQRPPTRPAKSAARSGAKSPSKGAAKSAAKKAKR